MRSLSFTAGGTMTTSRHLSLCWKVLLTYNCIADYATEDEYYDKFIDCRLPEENATSELYTNTHIGDLDTVHVVFATDFAGFPGLMASMLSLSRHLERPGDCLIHLVVDYSSIEQAGGLVKCFENELMDFMQPPLPRVKVHTLRQPRLGKQKLFLRLFNKRPFSYVRFYLAEYLPEVSRALWIDIDVIIKHDIAPLYRMTMKHSLAAPSSPKAFGWDYFTTFWMPTGSNHLLHDTSLPPMIPGLMLVDLAQWRAHNISKQLEDWTMMLHGTWWDLLPLNLLFQGRYDVVDWRWSVCGLGENSFLPRRCIDEAKLLHFSGRFKPWTPTARRSDLWYPFAHRRQCDAMPEAHRRLS